MIKALKEIKKQQDALRKNRNLTKDEEGRVVVKMVVRDDSEFLSAFSENDNAVISSDVADFLEKRTAAIPPSEQLTLHVYSDCITEEEQQSYNKAIPEYYSGQYAANQTEFKRNAILAIILGIAGIIVLALMIVFEMLIDNAVWAEVIDIIGWVFLWEAVDLWFIENHALKIKQLRYLALISATVKYFPLQNPDLA